METTNYLYVIHYGWLRTEAGGQAEVRDSRGAPAEQVLAKKEQKSWGRQTNAAGGNTVGTNLNLVNLGQGLEPVGDTKEAGYLPQEPGDLEDHEGADQETGLPDRGAGRGNTGGLADRKDPEEADQRAGPAETGAGQGQTLTPFSDTSKTHARIGSRRSSSTRPTQGVLSPRQ